MALPITYAPFSLTAAATTCEELLASAAENCSVLACIIDAASVMLSNADSVSPAAVCLLKRSVFC